MQVRSRRVETNLNAGLEHLLHVRKMQTQVTPRFEQAEGEVLGGTYTFRKGTAKGATAFDELGQKISCLQ
jgi:hypothetical protein